MTENMETFGSDTTASKPIPDVVMREAYLNATPSISTEEKAEAQLDKLPRPMGYRILILPYSIPTTTKGGIHLAASTVKTEELATVIGYVMALGPDAYKESDTPWCKKGDYVLFGRYAGARINMRGEGDDSLPLRLLNDDEILAVIDNPEDYVGVNI